ncbi:hypothetical protein ABVK25_003891 [Lepraria finkii]|uniref:Uncharacterized protein n=1 Tax=Lepraria finkii TaxID=1340010 RepID=A0ABR4BCT8_9LECA
MCLVSYNVPPFCTRAPRRVMELQERHEYGPPTTTTITRTANTRNNTRPSTPVAEKVLTNHPVTLNAISRVTNWCIDKEFTPHAISNTVLDILPEQPADVAIRKLRNRCSYMAKAPFQRKSKKRALHDKALKLAPATWLGPTIIKAHDRYQYQKDRELTKAVYEEYHERRENSGSTIAMKDLETQPAPLDWSLMDDDGYETDPWKLPPICSNDVVGGWDFPIPPPPRTPPLRARTYLLDPV